MAGKEHAGIEHAHAELFRDAAWLLTPAEGQDLAAARAGDYVALLKTIGARVVALDPQRHDRICAWVSHAPQMLATALAATLLDEFSGSSGNAGSLEDLRTIDGRTLGQMTRVASSSYAMWRDVALTNATNIEAVLLRLEQRLAHLREHLRDAALREEFEQANRFAAAMGKE